MTLYQGWKAEPETEPVSADRAKTTDINVLARELASFRQYPPEENVKDGHCARCGYPVRAHMGVVALGSDRKGTYAVTLHRGCAGEIQRLRTPR